MSVVSRRGVENLLSSGNLSSFWEMAIYTYTAADQSVCWYVVCEKKCERICTDGSGSNIFFDRIKNIHSHTETVL